MGQVPYAPADDTDDAVVTYTVKDLLADIKDSITRVDTKLDGKADRADVAVLERRVSTVEQAHVALKNRAMGAAAAASGLGGIFAVLIARFVA